MSTTRSALDIAQAKSKPVKALDIAQGQKSSSEQIDRATQAQQQQPGADNGPHAEPIPQRTLDGVVIFFFILSVVAAIMAALAFFEVMPEATPPPGFGVPQERNGGGGCGEHIEYTAGEGITISADKTISLSEMDGYRLLANTTEERAIPTPTENLAPYGLMLGGGRTVLPIGQSNNMRLRMVSNSEIGWRLDALSAQQRTIPVPATGALFGGDGVLALNNLSRVRGVVLPSVVNPELARPIYAFQLVLNLPYTLPAAGPTSSIKLRMGFAMPGSFVQDTALPAIVTGVAQMAATSDQLTSQQRQLDVLSSTLEDDVLHLVVRLPTAGASFAATSVIVAQMGIVMPLRAMVGS